jgi:hypothetical protein
LHIHIPKKTNIETNKQPTVPLKDRLLLSPPLPVESLSSSPSLAVIIRLLQCKSACTRDFGWNQAADGRTLWGLEDKKHGESKR